MRVGRVDQQASILSPHGVVATSFQQQPSAVLSPTVVVNSQPHYQQQQQFVTTMPTAGVFSAQPLLQQQHVQVMNPHVVAMHPGHQMPVQMTRQQPVVVLHQQQHPAMVVPVQHPSVATHPAMQPMPVATLHANTATTSLQQQPMMTAAIINTTGQQIQPAPVTGVDTFQPFGVQQPIVVAAQKPDPFESAWAAKSTNKTTVPASVSNPFQAKMDATPAFQVKL